MPKLEKRSYIRFWLQWNEYKGSTQW